MKSTFITLMFLLIPFRAMGADGAAAGPAGLRLNGSFGTDDRAYTKKDAPLSMQEYRLSFKAEAMTGESTRFYSETWVRSLGFPELPAAPDISLREAYVDWYGLLGNRLDLRIGRQRIAWGSGDKVNPTDNLNADDLEDIYDFGRHLGSDALKVSYFGKTLALSGYVIPAFRKATLPPASVSQSLMPVPTGVPLREKLPENTLADGASGGIRCAGNLFNTDFSLSYYYGRDDLPVGAGIITFDNSLVRHDTVELRYPRMQVAGADFAGQVGDIGLRGEAGVFFPERVENRVSGPPMVLAALPPQEPALDDKPYVKWVLGADYTFPIDVYVNIQWVHGFVFERGDAIEDYLFAAADLTILNGKMKVFPLGIGLEIKDVDRIADNYAVMGQPQVTWYPMDNLEMSVGAHIIDGKNGTTFGALNDKDEIFIKTRYSF